MSKLSTDARRNARNLLILCVLSLFFYAPAIIAVARGDWPFSDDAPALFGPWHQFAAQKLQAGVWPLWNAHLFAGLPFMANGQSGVLYAPNMIYLLWPINGALLVDALLHQWLLLCGAYFLGRALELRRASCVFLGLALGLGAAVASHLYSGHMTWHAARAWLPWILWALHSYAHTGRARFAWLLGGLFACQVFAGYPPLVLLSAALCVAYVVARTAINWRARRGGALWPSNWPRALAIAIVVAGGLSAIVLLPLREASALSVHGSDLKWKEAVQLSGSWRSLVRLLLPDLFGGTERLQWSVLFGAHEETAAIGLMPFLLALGAPYWTRNFPRYRRLSWWLLALMLGAVLMAMGYHTPLYRLAFEHSGLMRQLRIPVRWLEVWYYAAAVASALAFDAWYRTASTCQAWESKDADRASAYRALVRDHRLLAAGLIAVMIGATGAALWLGSRGADSEFWRFTVQKNWVHLTPPQRTTYASNLRDTALLQCGWTLLLCAIGLMFCWRGARTMSNTATNAANRAGGNWSARQWSVAALLWLSMDLGTMFITGQHTFHPDHSNQLPPTLLAHYRPGQRWDTNINWTALNAVMTHNLYLINGYDPLNTRVFWQFARAVEGRDFWNDTYQPKQRGPVLNVAAVTHTLVYAPALLYQWKPNAHMKLIAQDGEWQLWQHDKPWPRYYLTRHVLRAAPDQTENALQVLAARAEPSNDDYPILLPDSATLPFAADNQKSAPGRVLQWQRGTNYLNLQIESRAPAILSVGEAYFPGWHVWVDGREQPLLQANAMFQAVAVPRGKSRVQLVYAPQSFRLGAFLSLCALAACGAAAMAFVGGRRKNNGNL